MVVAVALVRRHRLLVACRAYPVALAGLWELPGGKVEAGETEPDAVVRECREELGVDVAPGRRIGPELAVTGGPGDGGATAGSGLVVRAWTARLMRGEPRPREHRELRWITAGQLPGLAWLPADRALVDPLARLLEREIRSAPPAG